MRFKSEPYKRLTHQRQTNVASLPETYSVNVLMFYFKLDLSLCGCKEVTFRELTYLSLYLVCPGECYGNAASRKRLNAEMPQKPLLRNFRFILGNPSKLEKGEGFPNIFEAFPNI